MESVLDWGDRGDEIHESFFPTGPRTHLWVHVDSMTDSARVSWRFTFMDLGMCHTMDGYELVSYRDGKYHAGTRTADTDAELRALVFKGKYKKEIQAIYQSLGIILDSRNLIR